MKLLSINIAKVKRLSLKEAKLPTTERSIEAPILVDKPATEEEIVYSKLVAFNPLLESLVESLDLVSINTGEKLRKVEVEEKEIKPPEPKVEPQEIRKFSLIDLAQKVIDKQRSQTKEEAIDRIIKATNVSHDRAENGFKLMLETGAIKPTLVDTYYLTSSTPF